MPDRSPLSHGNAECSSWIVHLFLGFLLAGDSNKARKLLNFSLFINRVKYLNDVIMMYLASFSSACNMSTIFLTWRLTAHCTTGFFAVGGCHVNWKLCTYLVGVKD